MGTRGRTNLGGVGAVVAAMAWGMVGWAQAPVPDAAAIAKAGPPEATAAQRAGIAKDNLRHFGDDPAEGGPIATDLSPAMQPEAVAKAMRKVGDWELARTAPYFERIWTWSVMYSGFMAAADALDEPRYREAMRGMGEKFEWKLAAEPPRLPDADNQSVGQTYLEFYLKDRKPVEMEGTKAALDAILADPNHGVVGKHDLPWWWCDALFMAPPVWVRMYAATGDKRYLEYMDREWARTTKLLYSPETHLYARDAAYLQSKDKNGRPVFWSRGNGWVMGGLVRTLQYLPKKDPARAGYERQLREMAEAVRAIQGPDGLWHAGLLDPDSYNGPEISGSALFTYAMAWGVNQGVLPGKVYRPVVAKAWAGMLQHIYADGRLGGIQQTGAEPAPFRATASYTYGVGAFLLAGSEVKVMAGGRKRR